MDKSISFVSVILLSGGQGTRMRSTTPKTFFSLHGKPVALHSLTVLMAHPLVQEIVVVCHPQYQPIFPSSAKFALPGERRQDSVYNGFQLVSKEADLVCIHDGARPFLSPSSFNSVLMAAQQHGAASLAVPAKNTIREVDAEQFSVRTLKREVLWEMHTPQVAKRELIAEGLKKSIEQQIEVTDDMSLVELAGHPIKLVQDSYQNFKLTAPEDYTRALQTDHLV